MYRKLLLILTVAVLIAAGIVWGIRFYRTKNPVLLYTALTGKKSPEPQTAEKFKPEIPEVEAKITGAAIYQNKVSAVNFRANPGAVRCFRIAGKFMPLAGSLSVDPEISDVKKIEMEDETPLFFASDNLTKSFAGKMVTLRVADGAGVSEISGTVIDPYPEKAGVQPEKYVILQLANRRQTMIRRDLIQRIDAEQVKPVLSGVQKNTRYCWQFTASKPLSEAVRFQYLARGLDWNASLHLHLNGNAMDAELYGEIVNNLDELDDVPVILASGAPDFDGGTDPMSLIDLQWRKRKAPVYFGAMATNAMMADGEAMETGSAASGTQNIRYFPAGRITMKKGEVLLRKLGSAQGRCERIVVWRVSPNQENKAAEALRFVNPFAFPVPEGTILVSQLGSAPFAQVKGKWLNVGEKRVIDLMDAPSVGVKREEKEIASEAKEPAGNRHRYRLCTMESVLTVKNHQSAPVRMVVENRFYGKLLSADGNPETSGYSVRREIDPGCKLTWEFPLAPGAAKKIVFRYQHHVQY